MCTGSTPSAGSNTPGSTLTTNNPFSTPSAGSNAPGSILTTNNSFAQKIYANPNPSFDFRTTDDLGLRTQSERGREALAALERNEANANEIRFREAQLKAIQEEQDRRDAPRRLAEERQRLSAQMQSESVDLQRQMTEQQAQQETRAKELQALQNERIAGIRSRGSAVTQSLQILARDGGQAPTATMSSRPSRRTGARSTTAGLRMGTTRRGTGSGSNLSV